MCIRDRASIHTDESSIYELSLASDYTINSAGLIDVSGLERDGGEVDINMTEIDVMDALFGQNKGVAIDLGATFRLNDKLEFSGSILDLGMINWKENAKVYSSEGNYEYKGLNLINLVEAEDTDFGQIADTLLSLIHISEPTRPY